jgi:NAD(P)-dependent dehydrogenase (short-subunit alcohol dehydrogenase family)
MKIAVIDGQGGGIGKAIVERLRQSLGNDQQIIALGTNPLATALMLKAGANEGASGENAIVFNASRVDIIVGSIGIVSANSMLGELSPAMAKAVGESAAKKVLIPSNRCSILIAGVKNEPLPHYIEDAIAIISDILGEENLNV